MPRKKRKHLCVAGCGSIATEPVDPTGYKAKEGARYCKDCLERAIRNGPKDPRPLGVPVHVKDVWFDEWQKKKYKSQPKTGRCNKP